MAAKEDKVRKVVEIDVHATTDAIKALNDIQKTMRELEQNTKRAETQLKDANKALSDIEKVAQKAEQKLKGMNEQMQKTGKDVNDMTRLMSAGAKALIAAFTLDAVVGAFQRATQAIGETLTAVDNLNDRAAQLGLSTGELQEWEHALTMSGGSAQELDAAVRGLSKSIAGMTDPTSKSSKALKDMGVSATDSVDTALTKIAESFKTLPDGMQKTALAMDLFGKSGAKLIPVLNTGAAGVEELKKQAHDMGLVVSDTTVKAMADLKDQLDLVDKQFFAVKVQIVEGMLPALSTLSKAASDALRESGGWVALGESIGSITVEVGVFATRLITYFRIFNAAREEWDRSKRQFWTFGLIKDMETENDKARAKMMKLLDDSETAVENIRTSFASAVQRAQEMRAATLDDLKKGFVGTIAVGVTYGPPPKMPGEGAGPVKRDKDVEQLKAFIKAMEDAVRATQDLSNAEKLALDISEGRIKVVTAEEQALKKTAEVKAAAADVAQFNAEREKDRLKFEADRVKELTDARNKNAAAIVAQGVAYEQLKEQVLAAANPFASLEKQIEDLDMVMADFTKFTDLEWQSLVRLREVLGNQLVNALANANKATAEAKDNMKAFGEEVKHGLTSFASDAASAIVDSFSSAKLEIDKVMSSILASMAKVMLQRVILQGLDAAFPSFKLIEKKPAAQGAAFDRSGVMPFAQGGIVSAPTLFAHGGGLGLMGEAGPEAIVPLKRTSGGDLGVQASPVNVTVINSAGAQVKTESTRGVGGEQQLRIMIDRAVEEGLGGGRYDRVMSTAYGVGRRGR